MSLEKRRYVTSSTGGSTGVTLKYLLDLETTFYGRIINDRGWGLAGYKPGDRIVIFAGGSLVGKMNFVKKLKYFLSNKKAVSTYGITVDDMHKLSMYINKKKVLYMYGYASSIYFFAVFLKENNIKIYNKLHGDFCTSEKLFPHQRTIINEMIGEVFDDYGLNDGGVSAHECTEHDGLHIDTERSILEVVDENGSRIKDGIGRIIATDLRNMSMPLIRYDTGDLGKITYNECKCGLKTPRLIEIIGRVTDYLLINGVYIGSPALTVLMGKLNLKMYQIIQQEKDKIVFKIVLNNNTIEEKKYCVNFITKSINEHVKDAIINFRFYDKIEDLNITNKYKFIINETI
jgi:phenylacetate-CoA ligase